MTCKNAKCGAIFTSSTRRKYCSDKCRARQGNATYESRHWEAVLKRKREYQKKVQESNPDHYRKIWRRSHFKKKYGITLEERDAMLARCGNRCELCNREGNGARSLFLDHDHRTGKVRGILCGVCNAFAAKLDADTDYIGKIAEYVRRGI